MGERLVFVYGTLKRGFPNHEAFMGGAELVGVYETTDTYPLLVAGPWFSPVLVNRKGEGKQVVGEVYRVDREGLEAMDRLESTHEPRGYRRRRISVRPLEGGEGVLEVFAYLKEPEHVGETHSEPLREYRDRRYVLRAVRRNDEG